MENKVKKLKKKYRKKTKRTNKIIMLFVTLLATGAITATSARYVYKAIHEHYISSKDFFFSSDKLSTEGTEYEITNNWSGAESYTIEVNVSSKKNDMATTATDITYDVTATCSPNITYTLSKQSGTIVGTDNNGVNEDSFSVIVNPANGTALGNGETAWVQVVATSTSPYAEVLTGKLILEVGSSDIAYEIVDEVGSPYLTVNITNSTSASAAVTLAYSPNDVLIDMTSRFYLTSSTHLTQAISQYNYINSVTANVASLGTTSVKFYKNDPNQNYSYFNENGVVPIISLSY